MSSPPISPELKELILSEAGTNVDGDEVVETTFGVDGEIATNLKTKAQITAAIVSTFIHSILLANVFYFCSW